MLIKDHFGDWGILLGNWEGFKKGVPGKAGIAHTPTTAISFDSTTHPC